MGVVERQHRHIVDSGISLLQQVGLPRSFWNYAFSTVAYLYNRTPTPALAGRSPFEMLYKKSPNLNNIRVFGSLAFPNLRPIQGSKFSPRSAPHVFIGYPTEHHGYMLINPEDMKIRAANDVAFVEDNFELNKKLFPINSGQSQHKEIESRLPILKNISDSNPSRDSQPAQGNSSHPTATNSTTMRDKSPRIHQIYKAHRVWKTCKV